MSEAPTPPSRLRGIRGLGGYGLVAAAAVSWGAQSVIAKLLLTSGLAPSNLISARTTLAFLVLTAVLAVAAPHLLQARLRDVGPLALLGIVGMALANYTYYFALTRIPVATAALLIYTAPLLVLAASAVLYREPVRRRDVDGALATVLGAALVARAYEPGVLRGNLDGILAATLTAGAFAFYNLWGKAVTPRLSPWTTLTYTLGAAALFWVPIAPPWIVLLDTHPPTVWAGIATVVLLGTLLPFALFLTGLARISAAHASVTSTIEPVVASAAAFLVLGESLAWPQLLGAALVLGGVALLHAR